MKIYTKTGDDGSTGLWGGKRVSKDHLRIHAYGTVDECNATLGLARTALDDEELDALLIQLQNQLFVVGADLASETASESLPQVRVSDVLFLEHKIDKYQNELQPLTQFILPGGHPAAAYLHLARTICRRAERHTVGLQHSVAELNPNIVHYLNRLSDLLFVLARAANQRSSTADVPWEQPDV